jgi:hypothetical protein
VFGRWLTLVRGLVGSQRIGEHRVPFGPSDEVVVKAALQHLTGYRHVTAAPTYREPQPVTGGRRSSSAVPSLLRSGVESIPVYKEWRLHTGQDLSSLPSAGPVVATAAGSVISAHLEPSTETSLPCVTGMVLSPATGTSPVLTPKSSRELAWPSGSGSVSRAHRNEQRIAPSLPGRGQRHSGQPGPVHGRSRCNP